MAAVTAYQCDGPDCHETTTKMKGTQYPPAELWPRLALNTGGHTKVAVFHDAACMVRWVAQQCGIGPNNIRAATDVDLEHDPVA